MNNNITVSNNTSYTKGVAAEKKAENFLKRLGFLILFKRYKTPLGEIDIIAKKGECFHFIEVKKRKSLEKAKNSITGKQIKRINNAANLFLEVMNIPVNINFGVFMDVIFVSDKEISLLENAWQGYCDFDD